MALNDDSYYDEDTIREKAFDVVISCSVLEHLIGIEEIDRFFSLTNDDGTVCIHTLVCEEVPSDPEWFYLKPEGHCTIWTNKAMACIYDKYGFNGCAYNSSAQMWFFFKNEDRYKKMKDKYIANTSEWTFSEYFVDYWKQLPYRNEKS